MNKNERDSRSTTPPWAQSVHKCTELRVIVYLSLVDPTFQRAGTISSLRCSYLMLARLWSVRFTSMQQPTAWVGRCWALRLKLLSVERFGKHMCTSPKNLNEWIAQLEKGSSLSDVNKSVLFLHVVLRPSKKDTNISFLSSVTPFKSNDGVHSFGTTVDGLLPATVAVHTGLLHHPCWVRARLCAHLFRQRGRSVKDRQTWFCQQQQSHIHCAPEPLQSLA